MKIGTYAKAIVGLLAPGVVTIGGALTDNVVTEDGLFWAAEFLAPQP